MIFRHCSFKSRKQRLGKMVVNYSQEPSLLWSGTISIFTLRKHIKCKRRTGKKLLELLKQRWREVFLRRDRLIFLLRLEVFHFIFVCFSFWSIFVQSVDERERSQKLLVLLTYIKREIQSKCRYFNSKCFFISMKVELKGRFKCKRESLEEKEFFE